MMESVQVKKSLRSILVLCLLMTALFLPACTGAPRVPAPQNAAGDVQDLIEVPQSLAWFAARVSLDVLRTDEGAVRDMDHFRKRFFASWQSRRLPQSSLEYFRMALERAQLGYAENLRPWTEVAWDEVRENAGMSSCPSMAQAAITTQPTNLRLAPTMRPRFARVEGAGQGYPFDDLQQSTLPAGMPVMVFHTSRDGAWFLVESPLASGWIQARDVAFVDKAFQDTWKSSRLAAFTYDNVPLRSAGVYQSMACIGTVLPLRSQGEKDATVLFPVRRLDGWAEVGVSLISGGEGVLAPMPLKFTAQAVAEIGDRMLGQSYGWGGLYENRDCSSMMHDLFTPFGIWLPRNSAAQARSGQFSSLEGLSARAKDTLILREAEPFRTLLWMKGHIGLYVGEFEGRPAFFHNIWGVRNRLEDGREGRVILGRAVISTTSPGRERPDVRGQDLLIERMLGMSVIGGRQDG